jgi:hypothetical protein
VLQSTALPLSQGLLHVPALLPPLDRLPMRNPRTVPLLRRLLLPSRSPQSGTSKSVAPCALRISKTPTAYKERFDYGWSGEWNAGSMRGGNRNDWHADHGMACENPNTSNRTIHLTSQQQARDAAVYCCMPSGDQDKGHLMTTVNTEGYVTVWFSPKQTSATCPKCAGDQNITDLGVASGPSSTS